MNFFKVCAIILSVGFIAGALGSRLTHGSGSSLPQPTEQSLPSSFTLTDSVNVKTESPAPARYRIDASQSKFIAHALAGGLLWFKGHDHLVAVREFTGEAELTSESVNPASLQITAKAGSMVETSSVFTEPQKQIINKE